MTSPEPAERRAPDGPYGPQPPSPRPPVFNIHGAIALLLGICVAVHVVRVGFLSVRADNVLLTLTAFWPWIDIRLLFTPVTYSFLHGDWVHLGINAVWLVAFGSPLAYRIGWTRSILFWIVAAVAAAMTHMLIYYGEFVPVIGASGAVSGFMGAASRYGLRANRRQPRRGFDGPLLSIGETFRQRGVLPFLTIWVVMNIAVGLDVLGMSEGRGIAWEAHIGGLLAGFFLVPFFDPRPRVDIVR